MWRSTAISLAWDGSPAILQSRAFDESGALQPTRDALVADQSSAAAMVTTLCSAVRVFEDGADASDDLTVVAFRYLGANPG